jgi:hypothetical protein
MARKPQGTEKSASGGLGVSGLKVSSGYIYEEYLPQLRGVRGMRVFQEMSENDATTGAVLMAITLLIRSVEWNVTPAAQSSEAEREAEFARSIMSDMSHSWTDFITEALSMLVYGWSYHEIVLKRRGGPEQNDAAQRSKFTDGRIGLRKLPPRSQDTLERWEMQDDGGIAGLTQRPFDRGGSIFIPIEDALLFRTTSRKNNPEGRSLLRHAYRSWHKLKMIEDFEAIGIERELAGLPVISIPNEYLSANATPEQKQVARAYEKIARDVRFNEQGGIIIPSDTFTDPQTGSSTSNPLVKVELLNSGGQRAINTSEVAMRYQRNIARSVLADFIMLGEASSAMRGGQGMHDGKVDFFQLACKAILEEMQSPLNMHLLPRVWRINNLNPALMPAFRFGKVGEDDLAGAAAFLRDFTGAGGEAFPDEDLKNHFYKMAGWPIQQKDKAL